MNNLPFDESKYRLGSLCKRGHNWNETGQSLRYKGDYSCVECSKLKAQEYEKRNREKRNQRHREWKEKNPEKWKAAQEKYWSKPDSLAKRAEYNRQYRQRLDYPEKHREGNRKYSKTEKGVQVRKRALKRYYTTKKGKACAREFVKRRRARRRNVHSTHFTEQERQSQLMMFGGECSYCGNAAETLDHFLPLSKGGAHTLGNLIPACNPCNRSKSNKFPDEWYPAQSFYSAKRWRQILKALGKDNPDQLPLF